MKAVAGIFVGVAVAVAGGIATSALGFSGLWISRGCLLLGASVGVLAARGVVEGQTPKFSIWDIGVLAAFAAAAFRAFFWLYFEEGEQLKVLSPHNLGDFSLHLAFVRYFASGVPFWPPSPILAGEPLTYPPGADFFNALLTMAGMGIRPGFILCGFVGALAGAWALWRYGGAFTVAAFLFGGGLAGFAIFRTGAFIEYGGEDTWKNAFLTMLVTQRGFLYALPVGTLLLWAWGSEFFGGGRRVPFWAQVLLYATLPLFQLHSFLFLSGTIVCAGVVHPRSWRRAAGLLLASFPAGAASVLAVTGFFHARGAFRFDPGWAAPDGFGGFLLEFGVALILGVIALAAVWRAGDPASRWIATASAAAALGAFLFPLNDWAWDNTKILIWAWIGAAPLIWKFVLARLPLWPRAALCGLLFFSGTIGLAAGLDARHGYELANLREMAAWEKILRDLPPLSVIACESTYNHPALLLGRPVVCGYEGHLSSHGLDYRRRLETLRRVVALQPGWREAARSLGAHYVAPLGRGPTLLPVAVTDDDQPEN